MAHSKLKNLSIVNAELWSKANWQGAAYLYSPDPSAPAAMALLFTEQVHAEAVVRDLIKQVGREDPTGRVRISILRGINSEQPLDYRIVVGTNVPPSDASEGWQFFSLASPIKTISPESLAGLTAFVSAFEKTSFYVLMPAILDLKGGQPKLLSEHSLVLRGLVVRDAWQIGVNDLEVVALYDDDKLIIPDGVTDVPAFRALESRRRRRSGDRGPLG